MKFGKGPHLFFCVFARSLWRDKPDAMQLRMPCVVASALVICVPTMNVDFVGGNFVEPRREATAMLILRKCPHRVKECTRSNLFSEASVQRSTVGIAKNFAIIKLVERTKRFRAFLRSTYHLCFADIRAGITGPISVND